MNFSPQSTPTACPEGPTCSAIASVVSPKPQPTSSTRAPAAYGRSLNGRAPCSAKPSVTVRRKRTNLSKRTVFQASIAPSLSPFMRRSVVPIALEPGHGRARFHALDPRPDALQALIDRVTVAVREGQEAEQNDVCQREP